MKTNYFTLLALLFSTTLIGQSLEEGLVAKHTFNNTDYQNNKFVDLSNFNNDITCYDISFFDDDNNGNSFQAVATGYPIATSYMELNENKDLTAINDLTTMSISFWNIRSQYGTIGSSNPILNIQDDLGTAYNLVIDNQTNQITLKNVIANGTVNASVSTTSFFPTGEWHHITFTIDYVQNKMKIYFDGILEGETDLTVIQAPQNPVITFAKFRNGENTEFTTCFDNMYIHNRTLSQDEINLTMENTVSIHNNILASDQVKVFPNPAKDISYLNIDIPNATDKTLIDITDTQGRLIRTEKLNNNQINIAQLDAGVYFLKIKTEEGSFIKKIMIE